MKKISILVVALVIVALALFVAVGLDGNQAGATPDYAVQTGLTCGACHVNPDGGGTLTALGTAFAANGHQLPTTTTTAGGATTTTAGGATTTTAGGATTTTAGGATTTTAGGATTSTTAGGASTTTTAAPTTTTTVPVGNPSFTG